MNLPLETVREDVEAILGESAPPPGCRATLNALEPRDVAALERLVRANHRIAAIVYANHLVADSPDKETLSAFIDDVVLGGQDIQRWGRWNALCYPSRPDLASLLKTPENELWAPFHKCGERRWLRVRPIFREWDWTHAAGAPATLLEDVSYSWQPPEGVSVGRLDATRDRRVLDEIESIRSFGLALRRWLASYIAYEVKASVERGEQVDTSRSLAQGAAVELADLSEAARAALRGLAREHRESGAVGNTAIPDPEAPIPGFRGPDHWYE